MECIRTAIGDLTRVSTGGLVTELRESRTDLGQRVESSAIADTIVPRQRHLLNLASLRVLDLHRDGSNLIIEPASFLRNFRTAERLGRIAVLHLTRNTKVLSNVLRSLTHGLHAVRSLGVAQDLLVERALETVPRSRHQLSTEGDADVDGAQRNLVGDILHGLQTG